MKYLFEFTGVSKKEITGTERDTMRAIYGDDEDAWHDVEDEKWPFVADLNEVYAFNPFEDKAGNVGHQTIIRFRQGESYRIDVSYEEFKIFYQKVMGFLITPYAI